MSYKKNIQYCNPRKGIWHQNKVFLVGTISAKRVLERQQGVAHLPWGQGNALNSPPPSHWRSTPASTAQKGVPSFCPNPVHPRKQEGHTRDVCRVLNFYFSWTKDFRKSKETFALGVRVQGFPSTVSWWIVKCLGAIYKNGQFGQPTGGGQPQQPTESDLPSRQSAGKQPRACCLQTVQTQHIFADVACLCSTSLLMWAGTAESGIGVSM